MPSHRRAALSAAIAFSFVFIFAIVALAQDRRQNAPGAFDFYVLALSWSPSYCESAKERAPNGRPDPQCNGRPFTFIVHGLSPEYEQGFPSYCQVPAQRLDRTTVSAALELMPSPRLIFRQWDRHGTCFGLTPHGYLPPALHGIGVLAATFVCIRLIVLAIRRWRVPVGGSAAALAGGGPGCRAQAAAARPLPTVKPRNNFGLAARRTENYGISGGVNYAHAFHAGSFADVFKHAVLCRILHHLRDKPAAFRVIDTHAGAGLYDLSGAEAARGGEWHDGIETLLAAPLPDAVAALLAPYLEVVGALNERGRLRIYPGSPAVARAWLRPQDRLIACELEPQAFAALARNLRGDSRIKTLALDGWTALAAYVPPKERRGLVLIDPPFEQEGDFRRLAQDLAAAHRKWATGIYMLWYPIKGRGEPDALAKRLRRLALPKLLRAELTVAAPSDPSRLNGCGLILVNPPWRLPDELAILLPTLAKFLGQAGKGAFRLDWLASAQVSAGR